MPWKVETDRARLLYMKAPWRAFSKSVTTGRPSAGHFWPGFRTQPGMGRRCAGVTKLRERESGLCAGFSISLTHTVRRVWPRYTAKIFRYFFEGRSSGFSDLDGRVAGSRQTRTEPKGPQQKSAAVRGRAGKLQPGSGWDSAVEAVP